MGGKRVERISFMVVQFFQLPILLNVILSMFFHEGVGKLNAQIFGVTKEEAKATFLRVFQQYRLAFVVLNLVPYLALTIMA